MALCGIAALATVLALVLQGRSLATDLDRAADLRLESASAAAGQLLDAHLDSLRERYASISETPEFRANLETGHAPTLRYFANRLAEREGAAMVVFLNSRGERTAVAGDAPLAADILDRHGARVGAPAAFATDRAGQVFAVADLPLLTRGRAVGRLVAAEIIDDETLGLWGDLCGGEVAFVPALERPADSLVRSARRVGELELRVTWSLEAERRALAHARRNLLSAGAVALVLAFALSLLVSRGLVRPIREIGDATEPIGRGEMGLRLDAERRDEIGDVARAFNVMLDRLEGTVSALRRSQKRLANAQHLARLGSWSFRPETGEVEVSEEVREIFLLEGGAERIPIDEIYERIHADDRERLRGALERCAQEGTPFRLDHRSVAIHGTERFLHSQGGLTTAEDGSPCVEGTVQDITERRLVEEQVRYLAYHDSLTGLGNRRLFRDHLQASIQHARRNRFSVGVLFLDLDGFKLVNDTFGHSLGDRLLRLVSERLVEAIRSVEASPRPHDDEATPIVARLGGDEFAVLLPRMDAPEDSARMARHLLQRTSEPVELDGHEIVVSGSLGIATWPADGDDVEHLLRSADTAMYAAKSVGRNNYQYYSEPMNNLVFKRLLLETKLRRAIEREELELQFQPKVELASGSVQGLEVLARWRDPELGVVPPGEFIPLAEEAGLIEAIGEWVLRATAERLHLWQRQKELAALRLSVNLSAHQLARDDFAQRIAAILHEVAVAPRMIDFEITETAVLRQDAEVLEGLEQLRSLGATVSLDDFGTGYSSLSYLRRLPLDNLKIDRSFVMQLESEQTDAALMGAIISMAKVLGLRVVVEGVETEGQLSIVRELGADDVQGNLFSPPVVGSDVVRIKRELEAGERKRRDPRQRAAGVRKRASA